MKRDYDLVRKLLLYLEQKPTPEAVDCPKIEGYDDLTIKYHLLLLAQAKLIDFEPELTSTGRIIRVLAFNPSWEGHDFIDAVRNDAVWTKLKTQASEKGASLPFEVLKSLAIEAVKKLFGL
jgi:Hypothetical protein (DUF2513)